MLGVVGEKLFVMASTYKKISEEFLRNKGFLKREASNLEYYEKNQVTIAFDTWVSAWILCIVIDNMVYYIAPILYIKKESELIKHYQECTGETI
jgi:hypothetical protein